MLKATVIMPTTGDRGPILPFSIGSILRQTVEDFEIFIIGDGVSDATREHITQLQQKDSRIRFFDHPKHSRRGEVYRHQALQEARGEIVTYLCDRDLWLPNHLELMHRFMQSYNFVALNFYRIAKDQNVDYGTTVPFFGPGHLQDPALVRKGEFVLSSIGHRLDLYHNLPFGWRSTPDHLFTDRYMWQQFLIHPDCRPYSSKKPSFLYFKRGHFPGWPLAKRLPELQAWSHRIQQAHCITELQQAATERLLERELQQKRQLNSLLLIRGDRPLTILKRVTRKLAKLPKRFLTRLRS